MGRYSSPGADRLSTVVIRRLPFVRRPVPVPAPDHAP